MKADKYYGMSEDELRAKANTAMINALLTQLITEVGGMYSKPSEKYEEPFTVIIQRDGYNQALQDILSLLKKHKDE